MIPSESRGGVFTRLSKNGSPLASSSPSNSTPAFDKSVRTSSNSDASAPSAAARRKKMGAKTEGGEEWGQRVREGGRGEGKEQEREGGGAVGRWGGGVRGGFELKAPEVRGKKRRSEKGAVGKGVSRT